MQSTRKNVWVSESPSSHHVYKLELLVKSCASEKCFDLFYEQPNTTGKTRQVGYAPWSSYIPEIGIKPRCSSLNILRMIVSTDIAKIIGFGDLEEIEIKD